MHSLFVRCTKSDSDLIQDVQITNVLCTIFLDNHNSNMLVILNTTSAKQKIPLHTSTKTMFLNFFQKRND